MTKALPRFNQFGNLRPPILMWIVMIYGLRHILITLPKANQAVGDWIQIWNNPVYFLGDIILVFVLLALNFRQPGSPPFWKKVWRRAHWLIAVAYAWSLGWLLTLNIDAVQTPTHRDFALVATLALIDLVMLLYVLLSPLVRQVVKDFPATNDQISAEEALAPPQLRPVIHTAYEILINSEIVPGSDAVDLSLYAGQAQSAMVEAAALAIQAGDLARAEALYRRIVSDHPESALAWHELGLIAYRCDQLQKSAALISRAVKADRSQMVFHRNLAEISRRLGRPQDAVYHAQCAVDLIPEDGVSHFNLALALTDAQKLQEALTHYQEAVRLVPGHAYAWNNLGVLLRRFGKPEEAKAAFEAALRVQPDQAEARNNLAQMANS